MYNRFDSKHCVQILIYVIYRHRTITIMILFCKQLTIQLKHQQNKQHTMNAIWILFVVCRIVDSNNKGNFVYAFDISIWICWRFVCTFFYNKKSYEKLSTEQKNYWFDRATKLNHLQLVSCCFFYIHMTWNSFNI